MVSAPEGLSMREAAQYLGVSRATIRRLVERGTLPAVRFGSRRWVILRADLDAVVRMGDGHGDEAQN